MKDFTLDEARRAIKRMLSYGHESVVEPASFTFFIEGISRALTHQLVRHRVASFTQQSMRHIDLSQMQRYYIKPESVAKEEKLSSMFDDLMAECKEFYNELSRKGIQPEDARFVLPIATQTKIAMTMNARELRHFFTLRCCLRSQWEIRKLANKILMICKKTAPSLFKNAGPACVKLGYCPESELSCGKQEQIMRKYKDCTL